jgi:RNA polymerase sigma-70 factor (ECF subfamily)
MVSSSSDIAELIARTALRDRRAFRVLYARTSAKLFGVTLRILRDRSEAEEALQEVYVKIWQRAEGYIPGQFSPMSWLIAIARNQAIDRLRTRRPLPIDLAAIAEVPDDGRTPEQAAMAAGERARIESCLDRLEADRATAVRAAYLDGFSYEELADRYRVPLNTMRTWLRRSLIKLRECLAS